MDTKKQGTDFCEQLKKFGFLDEEYCFLNRMDLDSSKKNTKIRKTYEELISYEHFSCRVLVTTEIIDNAVNICDRELKNIVINEDFKTTFIQMLGRKRCVDSSDCFKVYIPFGNKGNLSKRRNYLDLFLNYMKKVAYEISKTTKINPLAIKSGKKGDDYRKCIYLNSFFGNIDFNTLGYIEVQNEIRDLTELYNYDSFNIKVKWINEVSGTITKIIDSRKDVFIESIKQYLNISYSKSEIDVKKAINKAYLNIYGKECASDENESISLSRLQNRFVRKGIPIQIKETKRRFTLVYKVGNDCEFLCTCFLLTKSFKYDILRLPNEGGINYEKKTKSKNKLK